MTAVALHFDEISRLCRQAALASGYPAELAEAAGEMTLWLERHRIPGMAVLAALLEGAGAFDPARRVPETLESGELRFGEPLMAGEYLLANFDRLEFPARINGPDLGTLLIVPSAASRFESAFSARTAGRSAHSSPIMKASRHAPANRWQ